MSWRATFRLPRRGRLHRRVHGRERQIVPTALDEVLRDPDREKAQRTMKAVLGMGKIDLAEVQHAVDQT